MESTESLTKVAEPPSTRKVKECNEIIGEKAKEFKKKWFQDVSDKEWTDWRWQLKNRIYSFSQIEKMFGLTKDEEKAKKLGYRKFPISITPYYASLIENKDSTSAVRRAVIPTYQEFEKSYGEAEDPLNEDSMSPVPGIVHRYPDRVLFLVTNTCSNMCRYCTRSRMVGHAEFMVGGSEYFQKAIEYIERNNQIRDVLISGGDPFMLKDEDLIEIVSHLRRIKHVEIIRIGTKIPVVLPYRITSQLVNRLKKFHPLWMSIHFMHPSEITEEVSIACERLADAGIPLGSQTVLLKGINDDVETMKSLVRKLVQIRVRPYYIYQCDPIVGSFHFRTPVSKGLEIIQGLRGHTTGYACPTYVIDAPGGGGKIPLLHETVVGREGDDLLIRNFEGKIFKYPDMR